MYTKTKTITFGLQILKRVKDKFKLSEDFILRSECPFYEPVFLLLNCFKDVVRGDFCDRRKY